MKRKVLALVIPALLMLALLMQQKFIIKTATN
jgi:hypothetical protein